jgi:hypothetical protein
MRKTTYFRTNRIDRLTRWLGLFLMAIAIMAPVYAQTKPAAGTAPAAAPQEEPRPAFAVEQGFKYDPKNRLDPFTNPIPRPPAPVPNAPKGATPPNTQPAVPGMPAPPVEPEVIVPFSRPRGLRGLLLEDISIKGIVFARDPAMTMAIIQGPGNKTYNVSRQDEIFNAVIKDIRVDSIVFSPIVRKDDSGAPLTVKEVRSDSVLYTKLPKGVSSSSRDIVRKLHPAPGEPK